MDMLVWALFFASIIGAFIGTVTGGIAILTFRYIWKRR
jgi:uncharacterized membrane protein YheB (UPF0754 family)